MAALYDRLTSRMEAGGVAEWRRDLLSGLTGSVLEIGAGTGRNLGHYPAGLNRLVLAEPDRFMRARLQSNLNRRSPAYPAEVVDAPAEALPFADGSFDTVVSTLVLCSVRDPQTTLAEVRRVLTADGRFVFIEHVAAEDRSKLLRWQRRLEPVWKRAAGGCHLTRRTAELISASGFEVGAVQREAMPNAPPLVRPVVRGVARILS